MVDKELPGDLDGFVMAVVDLDNRLFRLRQDRKNLNNNGQFEVINRNSQAFIQNSSFPQPMEIANMKTEELFKK